MTPNSNLNVLAWWDKRKKQHIEKSYVYGQVFSIPVPVNQLPPFQLLRAKTGLSIASFKLVKYLDGAEVDITAAIITAGLEVREFDDYDLIIYPATVFIPASLEIGTYYAVMSDGVNTWYSEHFCMIDNISECLKIEWCHGEDFEYSGGHISYTNGYKNYLYLPTELGKPSYEEEKQVVKRDGYNFDLQVVTYKLYRFEVIAAEWLLDVMRTISQHDFVNIFYNGDVYSVDEFTLGEVSWVEQGHLATLAPEFKTDTVIVQNGRGIETEACGITPGTCIEVTYTAKALLYFGSPEYDSFYYLLNGVPVNFELDDYLLVSNAGVLELVQFTTSGYTSIGTVSGEVIYLIREGLYYFTTGAGVPFQPYIESLDLDVSGDYTVTWFSIAGTFNEFYYVYENGDEIFIQSRMGVAANDSFEIPIPEGVMYIRLKTGSVKCGMFQSFDFGIPEFTPTDALDNWMTDGDGNFPIA